MIPHLRVSATLPTACAAFAALVLLLALVQACTADGLLYSAESAAKTTYHEDISVTGGLTREDGALVLPEWGKSLNETGSVLGEARLGDLERAGAALDTYLQSGRSFHSLVSRLDLGDADIGQFDDLNRLNMDSLELLLDQCEEFEELQELEQQYREAGNTTMLISVQLRIDALRKEMRTNYEGYAGRQEQVVNISQRYGLRTTAYEQSVRDFEAIVASFGALQDEPASPVPATIRKVEQAARKSGTRPPIFLEILPEGLNSSIGAAASGSPGVPLIIFEITPDPAVYGDIITITGTVGGVAGKRVTNTTPGPALSSFGGITDRSMGPRSAGIPTGPILSEYRTAANASTTPPVTVYFRGKPITGVATGNGEQFVFQYRLEQSSAGVYRVSASVPISGDQNFTIIQQNTTTTLAARLVEVNGTWVAECTGNVTTEDGVPVRDLPVEVSVDGWDWWSGRTDEDGRYAISVEGLASGRHTLTTWSDTEEFPLEESESVPVEVWVPSIFVPVEVNGDTSLLSIVVYLLGIGGAVIGAVFYIRRRRRPEEEEDVTGFGASIGLAGDLPRALTTEEAVAAANALIAEVGDSRELVTRLYPWLVLQLDARNPHLGLLSRTPREIATLFAGQVAGDPLAALVGIHERVRYAGQRPTDDDIHTLREAIVVVLTERQHG